MRILYLADRLPPDAPGGAGVVAHALARGVSRAGAEVHAVSTHPRRGGSVQRDGEDFPVQRLAEPAPRQLECPTLPVCSTRFGPM